MPTMKDAPTATVPFELDGLGALLAGPANVVMQLALAPVGYGVLESKVDSGKLTVHPVKRFRTTFSYLAVALLGNDADRARYRAAVDAVHRLVRSDAASPVPYNAFDPELQLWVASCLYYGSVDLYERLYGPMPEALADWFYGFAARFGTTLQVRPAAWPADRHEFGRYWNATLAQTSIDAPVRQYLHEAVVTRRALPRVLRGSPRFNQWITTGFLPPQLRAQMGYGWSDTDEQRFARLLRGIGAIQRRLPRTVRRFPFNWLLHDARLRARLGRPLV